MYFKTKEEAINKLREMAKPFARRIKPVFDDFEFTYSQEMVPPSKAELFDVLTELIGLAERAEDNRICALHSGRFVVGYEYEKFEDEPTASWLPIMRMEIDAEDIL